MALISVIHGAVELQQDLGLPLACSTKFQEKDGPHGFGTTYQSSENRRFFDQLIDPSTATHAFKFHPHGLSHATGIVSWEFYVDPNPMVKLTLENINSDTQSRHIQVAFFNSDETMPFWLWTVEAGPGKSRKECNITAARNVNNTVYDISIQAF